MAGRRTFRILTSNQQSGSKKKQQCTHSTTNTHKITTTIHRPTNNNYTQDNIKLSTIHVKQIWILQHVQKAKTPQQDSTVYSFLLLFSFNHKFTHAFTPALHFSSLTAPLHIFHKDSPTYTMVHGNTKLKFQISFEVLWHPMTRSFAAAVAAPYNTTQHNTNTTKHNTTQYTHCTTLTLSKAAVHTQLFLTQQLYRGIASWILSPSNCMAKSRRQKLVVAQLVK